MSSQDAATPHDAKASADSSQPRKYCDIVMKGGITSGVVYPSAVYELSKTYQFKNVGGTSAGAIAAAATAAAQYGANHHQGEGFKGVDDLPGWLAADAPGGNGPNLLNLFQPQPATKPIFRILIAGIGKKRAKFFRIIFATIRSFPVAFILGLLPGLLLAFIAVRETTGLSLYLNLFSALLLIIVGLILSIGFAFYRKITRAIPQNYYGICSGFGVAGPGEAEALTPWLSKLVNRLAGKAENGPPLTFGELWGTRDPEAQRDINLQMLTTSLSHGRPYRLPFEKNIFYFDPTEFRKFFPEEVVAWMEQNPRKPEEADKYAPLRQLPAAADLPIVVATRLSLSFPVLLSAVPLYAIDFGRKNLADRKPEKCWFSDGGICSNFPVHFFDQTLPRWPTFAINLRPFHIDYPDEAVQMPDTNGSGIIEWWTRFSSPSGLSSLTGFFGAIKNTMQNWMDNTQTRLPGYRDRIAQISLNKNEGGLNLNMPPQLIKDLRGRGQQAAQELADRFTTTDPDTELSWDNHRWVRFRTTMSLLENMLDELSFALNNPLPDDRSYLELIERPKYDRKAKNTDGLPKSYPWQEPSQQAFVKEAVNELLELLAKWQALRMADRQKSFGGQVPKPGPELRIRPRI